MTNRFASATKTIAECDVCGFRYKLKELRNIVTKGKDTNIKACRECWSGDHPQNKLGEFPVNDPQAIRNPRPDFAGYGSSRNIQWGWNPVGDGNNLYGLSVNNLEMVASIGDVTVN
jgi:hypothetical protein|tara:strand:- start:216 stop:563 length:348 start_codon:yes stop_codon:yes gene_type:complete